MQHALIYGIVAALSFIGFVSLIYYLLLFIYRPKGNSSYIIRIPSGADRGTAEMLLYGALLKRQIFGDMIFDEIIIDKSELNDEESKLVDCICKDTGNFFNTSEEYTSLK